MAKTKVSTPKKGRPPGKAKATSSQAVPPRRSPRKAVQSAKSLGADVVAASSRVVKRASPKKATTPVVAAKKSSPVKNSVSPAGKIVATASPKRGRPRKDATAEPPISKVPKSGRITKSPASQGKKSDTQTVVAAPTADEDWTDSPKKKSPCKRLSKVPNPGSSSVKRLLETQADECLDDVRARQASLGGIRKSIEVPSPTRETRLRSRPKSPVRSASKSPVRSRSTSAKRSTARDSSIPSTTSITRSSKNRSQSPAKGAAQMPTNRASRSPSRKSSAQSTSARSTSPAKTTLAKSSPKTMSRNSSRSPSVSASHKPLRVEKTRSSRSPTKSQPQSPSRSRQVSPRKPLADLGIGRRSSRQSKSPTRSPTRESTKTSHSPSRRSSGEVTFEDRFIKKDEYGRALRRIESHAYKSTKNGKGIGDRDPSVSEEDERRARERGIQRAELEMGLHTISANKKKSLRGEFDNRVVRLTSPQRSRSGSRPSSVSEKGKNKVDDKYQPNPVTVEDDDELTRIKIPAVRLSLPRKPLSSVSSTKKGVSPARKSVSPARNSASPARKTVSPIRQNVPSQSPGSRQPSMAKEDNQSLSPGKPSAPNRGTIRSVTNPEFIPGTNKKNPFFESMPVSEIWHRMPPYFPFGETPFMRREMSRQINEDLARGQEQAPSTTSSSGSLLGRVGAAIKSGVNSVGQTIWRPSPPKERPSPWELPEVTDIEVEEALKDIKETHRIANTNKVTTGQKRKGSGTGASSPPKRVRRRSSEYHMRGSL